MVVAPLTKWVNSQGIRINKEILKSLNFNLEEIASQDMNFGKVPHRNLYLYLIAIL